MRITLQTGQDMKKAPANQRKCFIPTSLGLWTRLGSDPLIMSQVLLTD